MEDEELFKCAFILRAGEREDEHDRESPLKSGDRGIHYIEDMNSFVFGRRPNERMVCADSPVCIKTLNAFIQRNKTLIGLSNKRYKIEALKELFTPRPAEWNEVIGELIKGKALFHEKTFDDLRRAEEAAIQRRVVQKNFLLEEGERLFRFINTGVLALSDQGFLFAIMQGPLIESMVLWLHETQEEPFATTPAFKELMPLFSRKLLRHLDALEIVYLEGEFAYFHIIDYEEKMNQARIARDEYRKTGLKRGQ